MIKLEESLTHSEDLKYGGAGVSSGFLVQTLVGAYFAWSMLTESRVDQGLNLSTSIAIGIAFETGAAVHDILVLTSDEGYVAVQAKIGVRRPKRLDSTFGRVVSQNSFVTGASVGTAA